MHGTIVCDACAAEMQRRDDELAVIRAENARLSDAADKAIAAIAAIDNPYQIESFDGTLRITPSEHDALVHARAALEAARGEGKE